MTKPASSGSTEVQRLAAVRAAREPWRKWGPYLSERQWGTVREDYSESGDAWNFFTHDQARSRAYRWGEDGLAAAGQEADAGGDPPRAVTPESPGHLPALLDTAGGAGPRMVNNAGPAVRGLDRLPT